MIKHSHSQNNPGSDWGYIPSENKQNNGEDGQRNNVENEWEAYVKRSGQYPMFEESAPRVSSEWDADYVPPRQKPRKKRSRKGCFGTALLIILIILIVAGAAAFFILRRSDGSFPINFGGGSGNNTEETVPADTPVPDSEAEAQDTPAPASDTPSPEPAAEAQETALPDDGIFRFREGQYSGEDLTLYRLLASTMVNGGTSFETDVSDVDSDRIGDILYSVRYDYPEAAWCYEDAAVLNSTQMENGFRLEVVLTKKYPDSTIADMRGRIEAVCDPVIASLSGRSEYEKVLGVYEYVIDHTVYDLAYYDVQDFSAVFLEGRGVCAGYAAATQYLLSQLGIRCFTATGIADGEAHGWNYVCVDGEWYQLDTTFGDPVNEDGSQTLLYDYFCLTDEMMGRDHTADDDFTYPACTCTDDNYFYKNGRVLYTYDENTFIEWMREDYLNGSGTSFLCTDETTFNRVVSCLETNFWDLAYDAGIDATSCTRSFDDTIYVVNVLLS